MNISNLLLKNIIWVSKLVDVNFLPARPPEAVKDAFDDAISAQEDEQRYIREAEAYAREIEPTARGSSETYWSKKLKRIKHKLC